MNPLVNMKPTEHFAQQQNEVRGTTRLAYFSLIVIAVVLVLSGSPASAQTATPTPSEAELKLQEEKRLLELQKDIELAKKAIREAQPQPKATPLEGNTVLDEGVRLETALVSYKAMSEVANEITKEIRAHVASPNSFAIYDAQVVKDWRLHQALFPAFRGQTQDIRNNYIDLLCVNAASGVSAYFRTTYCQDNTGGAGNTFGVLANQAERSSMKTEAISGAVGAGATLIKSFVDLAALFRTDTKIEGKAVTIDNNALVAEVFRGLKNHYGCSQPPVPAGCVPKSVSLYYPGVFPPRINDSETILRIGQLYVFKTEADRIIKAKTAGKPALVNALNGLVANKNAAEGVLEQIATLKGVVKNLDQALAHETIPVFRRKLWAEKTEAQVQLAKLPDEVELNTHIGVLNAAIAAKKLAISAIDAPVKDLTDLNDRFLSFVDQSVKVDANGINTLALFTKSEDIESIMGSQNSYWLEIKSVSAGGNNRTRKNLIWFFAGARVDHSGGIIAEYTLYNSSGAVVYSDKRSYYEGYIQPKDIKKGKLVDTIQ